MTLGEHLLEVFSRDTVSNDNVNHPQHYCQGGMEVIDVIKAFTEDLWGAEAVCTGNVIKYILRWKHKNGIEDLRKAKWYLEYLIDLEERLEDDGK